VRDVVLIPNDEEYISTYRSYIYGNDSIKGDVDQIPDTSVGASSGPSRFIFGQQQQEEEEEEENSTPLGNDACASSRPSRNSVRTRRNSRYRTKKKPGVGGSCMKSQFPSQTDAPWMKTSVIEHSDASTPTTESIVFLHSISAMPVYASKSVEELRLEHYQKNDTRDALVMQSYSCLERPTPFLMAVLQGRLAFM